MIERAWLSLVDVRAEGMRSTPLSVGESNKQGHMLLTDITLQSTGWCARVFSQQSMFGSFCEHYYKCFMSSDNVLFCQGWSEIKTAR